VHGKLVVQPSKGQVDVVYDAICLLTKNYICVCGLTYEVRNYCRICN